MKTTTIILALAVLFFTACETDIRSLIPGTYVNEAKSEFSIANDTLIIKASEVNIYIIDRSTGLRLITNGKTGKFQYETERWTGIYDESTKAMTEVAHGRLITFLPMEDKLIVGKRKYRKLN